MIVGWLHLVLFFGFIWFGTFRTCLVSHGHCDPCEFLLAHRGSIELVWSTLKIWTAEAQPAATRIPEAEHHPENDVFVVEKASF